MRGGGDKAARGENPKVQVHGHGHGHVTCDMYVHVHAHVCACACACTCMCMCMCMCMTCGGTMWTCTWRELACSARVRGCSLPACWLFRPPVGSSKSFHITHCKGFRVTLGSKAVPSASGRVNTELETSICTCSLLESGCVGRGYSDSRKRWLARPEEPDDRVAIWRWMK